MQRTKISDYIKSSLVKMLNCPITQLEEIYGGNNNKIFKVGCDNSKIYAVKLYFHHSNDKRDRLGTEFKGLQFLSNNGVKSVPRPVVANAKQGIGVYEFIKGQKILPQEVTSSDIDSVVQFITVLKGLRLKGENATIPPASEACFSIQAITENISYRLKILTRIKGNGSLYKALENYLKGDFIPLYEKVTSWSRTRLNEWGDSPEQEIEKENKVLSPSDFGFHNALRRNDGKIIFLDFEYFGFDDPAKLISDFLLHPGMELSNELKQKFLLKTFFLFEYSKRLIKRFKVVYPLFGLKWCVILLNEFVSRDVQRRIFSSGEKLKKANLEKQLSKAKKMTLKIANEYKEFPYQTA